MTLGLLVALENANTQTHRQTRFMFYKYRYLVFIDTLQLARRCDVTFLRKDTQRIHDNHEGKTNRHNVVLNSLHNWWSRDFRYRGHVIVACHVRECRI